MFQLTNKPFPTRKRSSENLTWVAWASILLVAVAVAGVFNVTQIVMVERHDVRFVNLRMPVLEDFRNTVNRSPNDSEMSARSPLLFIGTGNVVFGAVGSVVSPDRGTDVLLLSKNTWREELPEKLRAWKKAKELLPARALAIAFDVSNETGETLGDAQFAKITIGKINRSFASDDSFPDPMVTIVNMGRMKLASTRTGSNP